VVKGVKIQAEWPKRRPDAEDALSATFCKLEITLNGENVSAYETEGGVEHDHLEIPAYYLAEWIAENWWPLLWEPRKSEEAKDEDPDFRFRHLISTAGHGFVLPHLNIEPAGESIHLYVTARTAQHTDARFRHIGDAQLQREHVEGALKDFVQGTVARLGSKATPLGEAWSLVASTDEESGQFCRLMGALGLSPYEKHDSIERALDGASHVLSERQLLDLCLTAAPENIVRSAYVAAKMKQALSKGPEIDLSPLPATRPDQLSLPAWKVGYGAAHALRQHLAIADTDIHGAQEIFAKVGVDPAAKQENDLRGIESPIVVGGIERHRTVGKMVLGSESRRARSFAAARATYFFLTGGDGDCRLITSSVTRDQQASRAFAAELLVPQSFVRTQADGGKLSWTKVNEIADLADVSPEVIKRQASNIGLQLN